MFYGINSAEQRLIFDDEFATAAKALSNSSMVVYPVDAHGLTTTRPDYSNFVTMKALAGHTGGRAFYNTNDIRGAIRARLTIRVVRTSSNITRIAEFGTADFTPSR
jgi:hypothetical protein